ncbi:helix-turn-helix domain-containing protein [Halodesulfurarchaeum formicicum]|uniref:Bacterio-opsin activator HTH domain-containing protein n=1 Tax=Halodesulfurarchaeum formicicum TaxID=1873524 RepID=A0A1J1AAR9_9EURY|nr:helix-turn-helix domain-containing protein [Halodesulfurarchaeum formicicum]APE95238.1 bacterio-opsin activator HTH domain-containing protein [Halodesulfurarchaeum formicicum]
MPINHQSRRSIELGVAVQPQENCPVRTLSEEVTDVRHHAHEDGLQCEIVFADSQTENRETFHGYHDGQEPCPALTFMEHDCVPNIEGVEDESLLVVTHPPNRESISDLLAGLNQVSETLAVKWISETPTEEAATRRSVDLDVLTDKQQTAIEDAVKAGYYEQPREISISELAAKRGISQSAMSQRLHAAEQKLLEGLLFPEQSING